MRNPFLELLRQNFRFGRMCRARAENMAGCVLRPWVSEPLCHIASGSRLCSRAFLFSARNNKLKEVNSYV